MFKVIVLSCLLVVAIEAKPYRGSFFGRSQQVASVASQAYVAQPSTYDESSIRATRQAAEADAKPEPYSFTFETTDEYGMTLTRTESGDANGNVKGTYMYRDPEGIYRTVEYGDSGDGFTAQIQTNEPGVISHKAADAEYFKQ